MAIEPDWSVPEASVPFTTRKPAGFQALAAHDEEAEEEVVAEESHQEREDAGTARVGVGVVVAGRGGSGMD